MAGVRTRPLVNHDGTQDVGYGAGISAGMSLLGFRQEVREAYVGIRKDRCGVPKRASPVVNETVELHC